MNFSFQPLEQKRNVRDATSTDLSSYGFNVENETRELGKACVTSGFVSISLEFSLFMQLQYLCFVSISPKTIFFAALKILFLKQEIIPQIRLNSYY